MIQLWTMDKKDMDQTQNVKGIGMAKESRNKKQETRIIQTTLPTKCEGQSNRRILYAQILPYRSK